MITHDLGVVAQICNKVAIIYAGEIVEYGKIENIYEGEHHHPYTVGLFGSIPDITSTAKRLTPIDGLMPDPPKDPRLPFCRQMSSLYGNLQQKITGYGKCRWTSD